MINHKTDNTRLTAVLSKVSLSSLNLADANMEVRFQQAPEDSFCS